MITRRSKITERLIFPGKYANVEPMKKDIHPQYFPKAKITCSCGNSFSIGATKETLDIEVCSSCHPFYTGKEKIMDKVGQVQKFRARLAKKKPSKK